MKKHPMIFLAALGALLAGAACEHLDLTPEGDPNRVIAGTVNFRADLTLPANAVVVVRVVDAANLEQVRAAANTDLPLINRPKVPAVEQVLGEQTINAATGAPVAFRIEYRADDSLLRHGLNLDARISYDGKVRFRTVNAHVITLSNANTSHEIWVEPAAR